MISGAVAALILFAIAALSPLLAFPVQIPALLGVAAGLFLLWRAIVLRARVQSGLAGSGAPGDDLDNLLNALADSRRAESDAQRELDAASRAAKDASARAETAQRRFEELRRRVEDSRGRRMKSASVTLGQAVELLQRAAEALEQETAATAAGAERQKELALEASSAMEEMSAAVSSVAAGSADASDRAETARAKARQGAAVVEKAVTAIDSVRRDADALGSVMGELGGQAESIGRIMEVINDIADQTNLLALNAAIEAARAGEAGRGFAVVADEVRKLAEKTMSATKDVGDVVASIQRGARGARDGVERTSQMVREATGHAADSGHQLTEIVSLADAAAEQVQAIAASASQQAAASGQVTRAITEVSRISARAAESMEGSARSARDLAQQVEELANLNRVFKLLGEGTLQRLLSELARSDDLRALDRRRIEARLREAMSAHPALELLYATDAKGVQIIDNISRAGAKAAYGSTGFGERWETRPWFVGAMGGKDVHVSESYVSQASGRPCITVSLPVETEAGEIIGVLAADVELRG